MAHLVIASFELNQIELLEDWKTLSAEIDKDIAQAEGFVSRDSGIDENSQVYCIVKWASKEHQESFMQVLQAKPEWPETMAHFSKIVNMDSMKSEKLELF
jgi:hypothetical protein